MFKIEFVDNIPMNLAEGVLYVSMKFHTAAHLCPCGCGEKVVTPFNPIHGWILTYDGTSITLYPSIGNYQFPCHSHYFIKKNKVIFIIPKYKGKHQKKCWQSQTWEKIRQLLK